MPVDDADQHYSFDLKPIQPTIGAEISGIDLSKPLSGNVFADLELALVNHKVVYARNQTMTDAEQVVLGEMFGELEVHPFRPEGQFPQIMRLDNHKDNPVLSTDIWHSDTTFRECPTKYSILRAIQVPPVGGDTLWADMTAAYEGLTDSTRSMIDDLVAIHDFKNFRKLYTETPEDLEKLRRMEDLYPNPRHPVVRTHPETGKKAIYVNPMFTLRIEGLSDGESDAILRLLFDQAKVPEYQFRLKWEVGTIAFWDNRSTQHYATNDYYPERRTMERVAVNGDRPR